MVRVCFFFPVTRIDGASTYHLSFEIQQDHKILNEKFRKIGWTKIRVGRSQMSSVSHQIIALQSSVSNCNQNALWIQQGDFNGSSTSELDIQEWRDRNDRHFRPFKLLVYKVMCISELVTHYLDTKRHVRYASLFSFRTTMLTKMLTELHLSGGNCCTYTVYFQKDFPYLKKKFI